jgi:hypothetical protein
MTKTVAELATRVLSRLFVTAADETPAATDSTAVQDFYASSFAELTVDGLTYWDEADIPDEAFEALVDLIAGRIASDFGLSRPDLEASGDLRLRRLASIGATGLTVTGSYF